MHPIDRCIQEMQGYLDRGEVGYDGLYAPNHQMNYKAMWGALSDEVHAMSNEDFHHPYVRRIRERMLALADEQVVDRGVFAINTTFIGRSAFEDHSPK